LRQSGVYWPTALLCYPKRVHPSHERALEAFVTQVKEEGIFDAVIVSGSIAKGTAREDSDLDLYIVVAGDVYDQRKAVGDLAFISPCDYPGGYVDAKLISLQVLRETAARGPEPMRASFIGSTVAHSRIGELQSLVSSIPVYPEQNRAVNMRDFFSYMALHARYFGPQAIAKQDPFLLHHSLSQTVLFAGRALLAYNRVLFPCPKQLLSALERAPDKPEGYMESTRQLLAAPTAEHFGGYFDMLSGFTDWGIPGSAVLTRFLELDEWLWLSSEPELSQR
jgi:Nucleotidyltransferase domain